MPKARYSGADSYELKGFKGGRVRITGVRSLVFQFPESKKTQQSYPPATFVGFSGIKLDENWKPLKGEAGELDEILIKVCGPNKETDELPVTPGTAEGPDDENPVDNGSEVGAEGNVLYIAEEDYKFNSNSGWIIFTKSAEARGWDPKINHSGWLEYYVGAEMDLENVVIPASKTGMEKDRNTVEVKEINVFPYDKKGKKATPAVSAGKGKPNGKVKEPEPEEEADTDTAEGGDESITLAQEVLTDIAGDNSGEKMLLSKIKMAAFSKFSKIKEEQASRETKDAAKKLIGDVKWVKDTLAEADLGTVKGDSVTFA